MSIDASVIIWTVVSFAVFMLLLNRFLFKPLLKFMDERQKRIDDAAAAEQEAQQERMQKEDMLRAAAEEEKLRLLAAGKERLEKLRQDAQESLERQEKEYSAERLKEQERLEKEKNEMVQLLQDNAQGLIARLSEKLLTEGN